jgi:hypothetical protein
MSKLADVQKWMTFLGWSQGGAPGAVKTQYGGTVIARYGDADWIKDVEEACAKSERQAVRSEIERRELLRAKG